MKKLEIYEFQLKAIKEALRVTANIHGSRKPITCHDRMVKQAEQYAENALKGEIDTIVRYGS